MILPLWPSVPPFQIHAEIERLDNPNMPELFVMLIKPLFSRVILQPSFNFPSSAVQSIPPKNLTVLLFPEVSLLSLLFKCNNKRLSVIFKTLPVEDIRTFWLSGNSPSGATSPHVMLSQDVTPEASKTCEV